jgi:hypothetical protein
MLTSIGHKKHEKEKKIFEQEKTEITEMTYTLFPLLPPVQLFCLCLFVFFVAIEVVRLPFPWLL